MRSGPSASFAPGGRRVVSFGTDKTARIWNVEKRTEIFTLAHDKSVVAAFFNQDGSRVVTITENEDVRIWDAADGAELSVLNGWRHAFFSPDGGYLVTSPREVGGIMPENFRGRLWPTDPLTYGRSHKPRDFFDGERESLGISVDSPDAGAEGK